MFPLHTNFSSNALIRKSSRGHWKGWDLVIMPVTLAISPLPCTTWLRKCVLDSLSGKSTWSLFPSWLKCQKKSLIVIYGEHKCKLFFPTWWPGQICSKLPILPCGICSCCAPRILYLVFFLSPALVPCLHIPPRVPAHRRPFASHSDKTMCYSWGVQGTRAHAHYVYWIVIDIGGYKIELFILKNFIISYQFSKLIFF